MFDQKTIKENVVLKGQGLHTGLPVNLRILPSFPDSGIIFVRVDQGGHEIPARRAFLETTRLSTTLSRNGIRVGTVEHLLAAFSGLGIDNARVEIEAKLAAGYLTDQLALDAEGLARVQGRGLD